MATAIQTDTAHLRMLDVRTDLEEVADLIELCFFSQMDAEGRDYVRHIRRVARNAALVRWIPGAAERVSIPLHGYVWVEDGRIVGNLTLIPFIFSGRWYYLIANVAVHPDFRRRGIGRMLTARALSHIREHGVSEAWLQVRDDNPDAIELYRSLGFVERIRRDTWQAPFLPYPGRAAPGPVRVIPRHRADWAFQEGWLKATYPAEVSWNLSFDWRRLDPSLLRTITAWINGETFRHWSAYIDHKLVGAIAWEPGRNLTDMLWLSTDPAYEDMAVEALLKHAREQNLSERLLMVNYPAGRAVNGFERAGFTRQNTLIWMSIQYPPGS